MTFKVKWFLKRWYFNPRSAVEWNLSILNQIVKRSVPSFGYEITLNVWTSYLIHRGAYKSARKLLLSPSVDTLVNKKKNIFYTSSTSITHFHTSQQKRVINNGDFKWSQLFTLGYQLPKTMHHTRWFCDHIANQYIIFHQLLELTYIRVCPSITSQFLLVCFRI